MRGSPSLLASVVLLATFTVPAVAGAAPASLTVDTTTDAFDGSCADGDCSLRDAVASVADGGIVLVPSGVYPLTLTGPGAIEQGDLDLTRPVTIARHGEGGAFLDATSLGDRVFQIASDAPVTIEGLTLLGGATPLHGGGIWVASGSARIVGVSIVGGSAGDGGGGVSVAASGRATIEDSLVLDNRSRGTGGGIEVVGSAHLSGSAVVDNRARMGGGVDAGKGTLVLENVTVAANRSRTAGGGIRAATAATLTHATVASNVAATGGGIAAPAGVVTFARTIVAGNRADVASGCTSAGVSRGGNVEGGGATCGFVRVADVVRVDPLLGTLRSNGGPTPTMALLGGSPALDVISTGCARRDQRGAPRDTPCDAGAYERVLCLGRPVNVVGTPGDDELSGGREPDTFLGLRGDDEFQGSLADDRACGGGGNDRLIGGPDDDVLAGQRGDDLLEGEDGHDLLLGGPGIDRCVGGPGRDDLRACEPSG